MQVSWIDADDVRDFVAILAEPHAKSGFAATELHTLPEPASGNGLDLLAEKPAAPPWQLPAAAPGADASPEIALIREKLRLIRDRAQEAGLLSKEPAPQPVAPAPPPVAPVAPPQTATARSPEPVAEPAPVAAASSVRPRSEKLNIAERLDEFAQWAAKLTTSEESFMLDDHGDLLWGSPTTDDLIVFAKLAMNATSRLNAATLAQPSAPTRMAVGPGRELQLVSCPTRHGVVTLVMMNPQQTPAATLREALALAIDK